MSTLALKLDEVLNRLDSDGRAELAAGVALLIQQAAPAASQGSAISSTQEDWRSFVMNLSGSLPDFPEDFEELPWEQDREPLT